jgi:tetrahydromethanopterin S-methyltransferase subunit G
MAESTGSRLDRIEEKLDKLTDAMIAMARAEEKLVQLEKNHTAHFERMNKFSAKLDSIEEKVNDNARTVQTINKLFWVALIAIAGAIASNLWM